MLEAVFVEPMEKAYKLHDYKIAAILIYQLNAFFIGFGIGIIGMQNPLKDYKAYYDQYIPLIRDELDKYGTALDNL